MIELRNLEVDFNGLVKLQVAIDKVVKKQVPLKLSYVLYKNKSIIDEVLGIHLKAIENAQIKYSEKDEDGNPIIENDSYLIAKENEKEFKELIDKLTTKKCEFKIFTIGAESLFEVATDTKLSCEELMNLNFMVR